MHNPKRSQTIIKDRIIPGSSKESIVYIGSHFDFACSSATWNTEPLGIEEALLKAPFSSLVLPTNSLVCSNKLFWLHLPLNKCSAVFSTIKEKMKDKGAILAFQYLWAAALLREAVKFPPSPSALCLCWPITPHIQKLRSHSLVLYTPLTISLSLWNMERQKILRELMGRNSSMLSLFFTWSIAIFYTIRWKFEIRTISTQTK